MIAMDFILGKLIVDANHIEDDTDFVKAAITKDLILASSLMRADHF